MRPSSLLRLTRRAPPSLTPPGRRRPDGSAHNTNTNTNTDRTASSMAGPRGVAAAAASSRPARSGPEAAADMIKFLDASWTQFHAVGEFCVCVSGGEVEPSRRTALPLTATRAHTQPYSTPSPTKTEEAAARLTAAGFTRLSERDAWALSPGGRYFFTRAASTLVAFAVGGAWSPGSGVHMVGAHTDSPCLKLKPVSKGHKAGYAMVNVEPYGGGLWTTWFDRDLTVAGRVLLRKGGAEGGSGGSGLSHALVALPRPVLRIPMLAIHLQREYSEQGFKPNKQAHLAPVLASAAAAAVGGGGSGAGAAAGAPSSSPAAMTPSDRHHPALLSAIADELGCSPGDIVDFDLNVCDTQKAAIVGLKEEWVASGRLDNLAMSWAATQALIDAFGGEAGAEALKSEPAVKAIALFDHEEVGSASAQGAGGPVMRDTLFRLARALAGPGEEGAAVRSIQASFLVSADMAHALHPNYADKHEPDHRPAFGRGLVIKHNANQRYATDGLSAALFREVGAARGIPSQEFCVRSDLACGSTIGPILASGLGVRTVDVGAPQLAMHSIREMAGVDDCGHALAHLTAFFQDFSRFAGVDVDGLDLEPRVRGVIDEDVGCADCK
jgi:aspartyl aminopeptidase